MTGGDLITARRSAASLDAVSLQLERRGLRFVDPGTEAAYRAWHVDEAIPLTRLGMLVSIVNWTTVAVLLVIVSVPGLGWAMAWIGGVVLPAIIGTLAVSYRPARQRWMLPLTAAVNTVSGLTCVWLCFRSVRMPEISMAATIFIAQFGFTIFRLRTVVATLGAIPYIALHELLTFQGYWTGDLDGVTTLLYSFAPVLSLVSGVLACATIDRGSRERFRQTHIIAAQRVTIDRERARADVAERSRELSEALSRLADSGTRGRLQPGDVVADRYRVVRALGAGGMGEVHEVERISDSRRLALKVLTGTSNREALMRFAREARIAATLDHPNVVSVEDVGVAPSGMYLVMELVGGPTLAAVAERYGDTAWALAVLRQIADALAAMHGRGIIHRDLKPANILLDDTVPKLTDFGIASLASLDTEPQHPVSVDDPTSVSLAPDGLTGTGIILGTPRYMAPELTAGVRDAQPTADIWSFGVIAHELLTGKLPFAELPIRVLLAGGTPLPPAQLDVPIERSLRELLDRCLDDRPAARPTARALHAALFVSSPPVISAPR
ncbi:MAG: serine/threonine protein kinase [Deltaproteobacteria bacterium]|nr:serine/threonine protein kinase [Deltaproteobacteria bacterium]MDQ3299642.1 serine/threonine protein kinase [Myxococcota bacterium]